MKMLKFSLGKKISRVGWKRWLWLAGGVTLGGLLALIALGLAAVAAAVFFLVAFFRRCKQREASIPWRDEDDIVEAEAVEVEEAVSLDTAEPELTLKERHQKLSKAADPFYERRAVMAAVKSSGRFLKSVERSGQVDSSSAVNEHALYTDELINIFTKLSHDRKLAADTGEKLDLACARYADFCQQLSLKVKGAASADVNVDLKVFTDVLAGRT